MEQDIFYEDAIQAFDNALLINPKDPIAWSKKGSALYIQGNTEESIKCKRKAVELDPDFINMLGHQNYFIYYLWSGQE